MNVMPPNMIGRQPFMPPPPLATAGIPPPQMHQMPPNMQAGPGGHPNHPSNAGGGGQFSVGTFSPATIGMGSIGTFQVLDFCVRNKYNFIFSQMHKPRHQ
jgi:hypothetical protein